MALDNCPDVANHAQFNYGNEKERLGFPDGDELGNTCHEDDHNDGVINLNDDCLLTYNPKQRNDDRDGVGDRCNDALIEDCGVALNYELIEEAPSTAKQTATPRRRSPRAPATPARSIRSSSSAKKP